MALRRESGFTLVELLVVVLIIGILIAVSAPSFLGQSQKAQDSAAKQYLTVAYKEAASAAVDHNGDFADASFDATALASQIAASEPELTAVAGSCPADATSDQRHIVVDSSFTQGGDLKLCNDPTHTVWILTVTDHSLQPFTSVVVDGSGVAQSAPAPVSLTAPVVSDTTSGSATVTVGDQLSASTGTWSNSPTGYSYSWRSSADGSSWTTVGTGSSYSVQASDQGQEIDVVVQATNSGGAASAASSATAAVLPAPPTSQSAPTLSGTPRVGQTLTATSGGWSGSPSSYSYQWQRCDSSGASCSAISGATSSAYTLVSADNGQTLRVSVQATNAGGASAPATSAASAVVSLAYPDAVMADSPVAYYRFGDSVQTVNFDGGAPSWLAMNGNWSIQFGAPLDATQSLVSDTSGQAPGWAVPSLTVPVKRVIRVDLIDSTTGDNAPHPGLIFNWQDANNYDAVYFRSTDKTVNWWAVHNGVQTSHEQTAQSAINSNGWNTFQITEDNSGTAYLSINGAAPLTFSGVLTGTTHVGFWSHSGTASQYGYYDNLNVYPYLADSVGSSSGVVNGGGLTPSSSGGPLTFGSSPVLTTTGSGVVDAGLNGLSGSGYETVELWMKPTATPGGMVVGWTQGSTRNDLWLSPSGHFGFNTGNGDVYGIATPANFASTWHHVVFEWNGTVTQAKLWIDGVQQALGVTEGATGTGVPITNGAFAIGGVETSGWAPYDFSGSVAEVAVYNGALSQAQISAHYAAR